MTSTVSVATVEASFFAPRRGLALRREASRVGASLRGALLRGAALRGVALRGAALLASLVSGCAEPQACPHADLAPLERPPAYVFVASDYASSAIGLLDEQGELLREAWLDSGTVPPGLVTPLSGDVVLASTPLSACVIAVIDRFGQDVLTFLDVCAREPLLGQLAVGSGRSNPRDVVPLDERRALVSRYASNLASDTSPLEHGNDLLLIDWRERRVLSRIDLAPLDAFDPEHVQARPDRMVMLTSGAERAVVVGLARLSGDYMVAGPGAVVALNADELSYELVPLEGLMNCGEVDAVPGHAELAVVTCAGRPFASGAARREGAGVALLELRGGTVEVRGAWYAEAHEDAPVLNAWSVPLSAERVVTVAMGDFGEGIDDELCVMDPAGAAEPTRLAEAASAFVLGDGAFDPSSGLLLVPDAASGSMRRFDVDGARVVEGEPVVTTACRGLPPREVRRIARP